ncbi:MAG: hypothetical protein M3Z16_09510 [Pseudomonadota bacterium]|nr:hypothetical protein [Pseudomonadota bacterium]
MNPVDAIKRRLHRDIVADPILHARVLNLYLCGEAYPHTVDDYFPIDHVDCPELRALMQRHMADEDKHIALYAKAIKKLGAEVVDLPPPDVFNHVIRSHTRQPWRVAAEMPRQEKLGRLAGFFAHAHWLEKRIARSLDFHVEACAHAATSFPGKVVATVLGDEQRHVGYTREAVFDLVPRRQALAILDHHRRAERRANLDFSCSQLRRLLVEEAERWPAGRKPWYGACASAMRLMLSCA